MPASSPSGTTIGDVLIQGLISILNGLWLWHRPSLQRDFCPYQAMVSSRWPPTNSGVLRDVGSIPGWGRSPGVGSRNLPRILVWRIPRREKICGLHSIRPQRIELTEHLSTSTWAVFVALSTKAQQRTKQRAWVSGLSASHVPCPHCGAVTGEPTTDCIPSTPRISADSPWLRVFYQWIRIQWMSGWWRPFQSQFTEYLIERG